MQKKQDPTVASYRLSQVKSKNTKPEIKVFRELKRRNVYFKKHYRKVVGTPDIALPRKKKAIFIDGDFWHGFRYPIWGKRLASAYWKGKIERNRERDKRTFRSLRRKGWKVLRVWEHEIEKGMPKALGKITNFLAS